jgi:colanic acid/amylovoran biosynthesis glycosyltransferase
MRLAIFTAEFPGRINTFFARDVSALIRNGVDVDIFPIYPLQAEHWSAVPDCLSADVLPRGRVHHVGPLEGLLSRRRTNSWRRAGFVADSVRAAADACRFGPESLAKTGYASLKALTWAKRVGDRYDHVLAYWGNYAATAAHLFHRLLDREIPLSILLHAHDLYDRQVFLAQKLLYADNILVVCEFNRRFLATRFPDIFPRIAPKVHLHHLGVDVASIKPSFEGRPGHHCLAVGRLDPSKGFDDLIRAAALLHKNGRDLTIELVGDGPQLDELRRLAASLGVSERVLFTGWLPFDAVPKAMKRATMLVHPSCGLGDAVPTVIKEAMALGTPVVGTTAVGIPELLDNGRCGVLVPERNVERLAAGIDQLLIDPALRQRLARDGRAFAEQTFDLWRNGERLAALLRATRRTPAGATPTTGPHVVFNAS